MGACAPANGPSSNPSPGRVIAVDADGRVLRQAGGDERSRAVFPASKDRAWKALVASYTELGIMPTVADMATGQYGNVAFAFPRRFATRPIGQFFDCGSNLTGALVDAGQVTAAIITTLTPLSDSTTAAATQVSGTLRRNDGAAGEPIHCTSTGALEEHLRMATERKLTPAP